MFITISKQLNRADEHNSLSYALSQLGVRPSKLIARIGMDNSPSIKLFESLDFRIEKRIEVFSEVELRHGLKSGDDVGKDESTSGQIDEKRRFEETADRLVEVLPRWAVELDGKLGVYDAAT